MPRDNQFGDIVDPSVKVGTNQWYTIPLSIVAHVAVILGVVIIPLMAADILPTPAGAMASVRFGGKWFITTESESRRLGILRIRYWR